MKSATNSRAALRADPSTSTRSQVNGRWSATAAKFAELGHRDAEQNAGAPARAYRDWRVPQAIGTLTEGEAILVGRVQSVKERAGRFPLVTVNLADEYRHDRGEVSSGGGISSGASRPVTGCSSVGA